MSGGEIKLTTTEILENLRAAFLKFDGDTAEALLRADSAVDEMRLWLEEKRSVAERGLADAEAELSEAQSALSSCEASGYWDDDGSWIDPECYTEAAAVNDARSAVQSATEKLGQVRFYQSECERAILVFHGSRDFFRTSLFPKMPTASQFLVEKEQQYGLVDSIRPINRLQPAAAMGVYRHCDSANTYPAASQPGDMFEYDSQAVWADRYLALPESALTVQEREALIDYQGEGHEAINAALRSGEPLSAEIAERVNVIDHALTKASLPVAVRLIRGCPIQVGEEVRIGGSIPENGFFSASVNYGIARAFSEGTVIDVTVSAGFKGIYLRGLGGINDHELEILLPRNTRIVVTGRIHTDGVYYLKGYVTGDNHDEQ